VPGVTDPTIQRIESFRCRRDPFEVLYWSLWKEPWTKAGPFGRIVLPLDQALNFVARRGQLLGYHIAPASPKLRKVEPRAAEKMKPGNAAPEFQRRERLPLCKRNIRAIKRRVIG
jgi:hypothetical protein